MPRALTGVAESPMWVAHDVVASALAGADTPATAPGSVVVAAQPRYQLGRSRSCLLGRYRRLRR